MEEGSSKKRLFIVGAGDGGITLANRLLGGSALFNGRTHCPMELGDHKAYTAGCEA